MAKSKLPKSIRKFIRKEKEKIRKSILDKKEQERLIQELYQKYLSVYNNRNEKIFNETGKKREVVFSNAK